MASTTLFAPQVRAVQPAFVYKNAFATPLPNQIILEIDLNKTKNPNPVFVWATVDLSWFTTVDWGDGTVDNSPGHRYATKKTYICTINVAESMSIPKETFKNNKEITKIAIGEGITTIGDYALGCENLKEIYAFNNDFNFKKEHFDGNSVKNIIYVTNKVKVYFNLSSYNIESDVKYILYTIIDPNKASTWGTNSVIEAAAAPAGYLCEPFNVNNKDNQSGEYYIEINLSNGIKFKELTKNQFYQVQLYFCDITTSITGTIDQEWLNTNKNNISVASQATLIRPISNHTINFDIQTQDSIYDLDLFKGWIEYDDSSTVETIEECSLQITLKKFFEASESIEQLPIYTSKNQLGLRFEIPIIESLEIPLDSGEKSRDCICSFSYATKHGYRNTVNFQFTISPYLSIPVGLWISIQSNPSGIICTGNGVIGTELQRKAFESNRWETLKIFQSSKDSYYDYDFSCQDVYQYRRLAPDHTKVQIGVTSDEKTEFTLNFEDIYLSDTDTMLAVRYNPNISGLKYVTQEAITNTLGGRYPVIRKNGDTRYRQFNLSGTLFMNASDYAYDYDGDGDGDGDEPSTSVAGQNYSNFFDHLGEKPSLYIKDITRLKNYSTKDRLERQARELAIDFLTNNSIKLFRSPTEGNMIVYLSGVSFTPNKQLGRNVYDFSCTVTEVCEYNMENIKKYNLNDGRQFQEATKTTTVPSGDPVTIKGV